MNALKLLGLTAVAALGASMAQAQMTPISLTSGSYDVNIVAGDAANTLNSGANLTATMDSGTINWTPGGNFGSTYYNLGYNPSFTWTGLPMGGTFTSLYDGSTTFALQPITAANNAALLDWNDGADAASTTLTLATPAAYTSLALLGASGGGGTLSYSINYANAAPATTGSFTVDNWYDAGGPIAFNEYARVYESGDNFDYANASNGAYLFQFNLADPTDNPISSVTISESGYDGANAFFALSGAAAPVPEPGTLALAGFGGLMLFCGRFARRRS